LGGGDENKDGDKEPVLPGAVDHIQPVVDAAITVSRESDVGRGSEETYFSKLNQLIQIKVLNTRVLDPSAAGHRYSVTMA